jgi:hypothetical protein
MASKIRRGGSSAARGSSGRRPGGVARRGEDSAARGRRWRWAEAARGSAQSSAGVAGAQHMAGRAVAARMQRSRGGRERGRRKRTGL